MAQQINLFSPILLAPKRYFSAAAMGQALAVFALGMVALSAWSILATQALRQNLAAATAADLREKRSLTAELARQPALPTDTAALEQELAATVRQVAEREQVLAGLPQGGSGHSALLRLLAQSVPPSIWLSEIRIVQGRLELAGTTLQPEALRPWLAQLAAQPALEGQSLRAVKIERSESLATEAWTFRVVSSQPRKEPS